VSFGVFASDIIESILEREDVDEEFREVILEMKSRGAGIYQQSKGIWRSLIGGKIKTLVEYSVTYGNNDDPTKAVTVSRYYGPERPVYHISHQGTGLNYRTLAEQFLTSPESFNKTSLEAIKEFFKNEDFIFAFSKSGNDVYITPIAGNPIIAN